MSSKIRYGTNESIIEPSSSVYRIQSTDDERKLSVERDGHVLDLLIMSERTKNESFFRQNLIKWKEVVRMRKVWTHAITVQPSTLFCTNRAATSAFELPISDSLKKKNFPMSLRLIISLFTWTETVDSDSIDRSYPYRWRASSWTQREPGIMTFYFWTFIVNHTRFLRSSHPSPPAPTTRTRQSCTQSIFWNQLKKLWWGYRK